VEFALISAGEGAEILPATATTDPQGLAEAHVLLGTEAGPLTGEARLSAAGSNPPKASFTAVAMSGGGDNQPPAADFEVDCQQLTCAFSDRSTDQDGGVVSWAWDFGDGATSTDRNPSHAYAVGGTFSVRLTVTDGGGAQDTKVRDAQPQAPPPVTNEPPQADFDMHCDKLACEFTDKSKDDDGAIVAWAWSFGDGATSTEADPEHTYAARGHYEVVLTVTDDDGATASKTRTADAKD
jgi:PKD repeat protein